MPNWCENQLTVYGDKEEMDRFMKVISLPDGGYSLLQNLYPTPEDLLIGDVSMNPDEIQIANEKKYGYRSWYDWRIDKWGTKWTESDLYVSSEYKERLNGKCAISFDFETAWSPPIEAFNVISADYQKLVFALYYQEPGMGFCGRSVWANGEQQESEESDLITSYFDEEYLFDTYIGKN